MAKVPYIPLYIGDWEQDTNCLSLQAEAAWLKIIIKMHKDDKSGVYKASTKSLQKLFKCDENEVQNIISELVDNNIGIIELDESGFVFTFKNRRMLKEKKVSNARTKAVQNRYKSSTKTLQNADIDNEYDNEIELGKEEGTEGERDQRGDPDAFIVPRMVTAWQQTFPKYLLRREDDFPALKNIAFGLCDYLQKPKDFSDRQICDAILKLWENVVEHIRGNDHYSKYSLSQIDKYTPSIMQSFDKPRQPDKSALQYLYDRFCEEKIDHRLITEEHYQQLFEKGLVKVDRVLIGNVKKNRINALTGSNKASDLRLLEVYQQHMQGKIETHPLLDEDDKLIELHAKRTAVIGYFKKQKTAKAVKVIV